MLNLVCIITEHNNKLIKHELPVRRPLNTICNCFGGHKKCPQDKLKEASRFCLRSPPNTEIGMSL